MSAILNGKRVAFLVTDGFEQVELTGPREALERNGAVVDILSDKEGTVRGWNHDKPADEFAVDATFEGASLDLYDALVLPGGVQNSDTIRIIPAAQKLVKSHDSARRPLAVICHGAWLLVSCGLAKGRRLTSYKTLQDDIRNAGGEWVDEEVVVDGNLITSRKPDDIPAFSEQLVKALA
ncbi:oxidative-stress-resistance chaperone [Pseudomonas putida]|jgi:protease I|uniref:Type 1 glutamine amidotransferase n=2 Tax=Pseudomonas TaxID=286 RepID=A0AAX0VZD3_9PSED|nr:MULTISPECIES: type 1 glutamine amidotransferase domain-containing protein [Pseudomonas]MBH3357512.1 type 1 glutamine amidotransferase [Pseudomonas guariconensis]MCO7622917.1 type 1 glutamine amidotransferase [Pseudomonas guariconensis]MDD2091970.1 type 1 glutamine amidotransferase [Pseudomonas guariconensis]MDM9591998.1 type 1 glutamine amidotransferase domain-containing protein [Pseudomonas guariconensis]MDM9604825.1 type 1 glutamine amidotransferase domain-containing protein [Pseudomonas 